MVEFNETTGGAATDNAEECADPDAVHTDAGGVLAAEENVETDTGSEFGGKDRVASEKEGAAGEAVDIVAVESGVAEAAEMEKVGPGGWGSGKELMEVMGAMGGGAAEGEPVG